MVIEVMWLLIMAVVGTFAIEFRDNYRLHKLIDARIELLRLQPYHARQKRAFGTKHQS